MNPTPWYKNFWPWFLMFFPLVTIIACVFLVTYAVGNGPDMVVDDYYKKGKAINLELSKFNKAKALYLHGDLIVENDKISFDFTKGDRSNVNALKVSFYHRTIKEYDFSTTLLANASGTYTALLDKEHSGAFTVFIEPMDGSWKMKENLQLPTDKPVSITPQYK
ncbi:FixH family protein [Pseudoalteromonas luteoviolacea]|nr:FixH family protein [Pseudoalteromonas luteoviolacea]MBQ4876461.1 FixH family protein [Pseudoalteromonas luteoviolacea]MBQ4905092.1 FixH family protein [Pseudoalteromonas luteoviolacea]MCF6439381.1 FixH family protein [Pseudoalteromonas luteoviolacea]